MIKKGLVVKVNQAYIIVMTEQGDYDCINQKEQVDIGAKIMYTEEDIIAQPNKNASLNKYKTYMAVASITLILILGLIVQALIPSQAPEDALTNNSTEHLVNNPLSTVATIITVDINPSFKLKADKNDLIVEVEAMNADAKTIDLRNMKGLKIEKAIEKIVYLADQANFINTLDEEEDYVLVTLIDVEMETQDNKASTSETVEADELRDKVMDSTILGKVNIAITAASKEQLEEAERKNIPVGLYVAGIKEKTSVKEYFSKEKQKEAFKEKGKVIDKEASKEDKNALKDALKEIKEKEKEKRETKDNKSGNNPKTNNNKQNNNKKKINKNK